ncbi:MAG: DUF4368 domain-containing protein, partial [Lachnospiraceae bacterium]|nr:DUF4368 domain-containing protein [Lachnospiraceae bacterium]
VDNLEQLVVDELNRLIGEYLNKDELAKKIMFCGNLEVQKDLSLSRLAAYERKATEFSKGIRDLYMDKVKGIIAENDYLQMSAEFTDERDRLERMIADEEKKLTEIEEKINAGDNRRELIKRYTNLEHMNRTMVEILIDHILVGKRIPGSKDVPIEIHWKF